MNNQKKSAMLALLAILLLIGASSTTTTAYSTGISGEQVRNGCVCHSGSASPDVTVTLDGVPSNYSAGDVLNLTVTITGGPAASGDNHGGFNLVASAGTLNPIDNTTQIMDGDATHTDIGNNQRSWQITWTAPSDNAQDITFTAHGNSVNGDATASSDDMWNKVEATIAGVPTGDSDRLESKTPGFTLMATLAIVCLAGIAIQKRRQQRLKYP